MQTREFFSFYSHSLLHTLLLVKVLFIETLSIFKNKDFI